MCMLHNCLRVCVCVRERFMEEVAVPMENAYVHTVCKAKSTDIQ